jgi:hypothetical protein
MVENIYTKIKIARIAGTLPAPTAVHPRARRLKLSRNNLI